MKDSYLKYSLVIVLFSLVIWTISCSGRPGTISENASVPEKVTDAAPVEKIIKLISPEEDGNYKTGDIIKIVFEPDKNNSVPDSVIIFFNGKKLDKIMNQPWICNYKSDKNGRVGRASVKLVAYKGNYKPQVITRFVTMFSDIVPKTYHFKIVNTYPHDRKSFTQGLIYDGGFLYEGTGQYGESYLKQVDLKTGTIIKQQKIEDQLFGEGITILGEKIFQLTWTSKVGFVYDKNSFKQLNKIYYQTEGWGLAAYKDELVMSDGTNSIYFIEPELFTVVSSIEVYDDKKMVGSLNELEIINGEIWANIYQTNLIARIDPNTGKVIAYIDLEGILPQADMEATTDVLNGIAWDPAQNRIFVTGKLWPKLFEISLIE
jgi:glutamine cyclotransferase